MKYCNFFAAAIILLLSAITMSCSNDQKVTLTQDEYQKMVIPGYSFEDYKYFEIEGKSQTAVTDIDISVLNAILSEMGGDQIDPQSDMKATSDSIHYLRKNFKDSEGNELSLVYWTTKDFGTAYAVIMDKSLLDELEEEAVAEGADEDIVAACPTMLINEKKIGEVMSFSNIRDNKLRICCLQTIQE